MGSPVWECKREGWTMIDEQGRRGGRRFVTLGLTCVFSLCVSAQVASEKGIILPDIHKLTVNAIISVGTSLIGVPIDVTVLPSTSLGTLATPFERNVFSTWTLQLTAPEFFGDYRHVSWYEGLTNISDQNSITVQLNEDRSFTVLYVIQQRILTVESYPDPGVVVYYSEFGAISTPQGLSYSIHSTAHLTAPQAHNNRPFARWMLDGKFLSADPAVDVVMDADHNIVAQYGTGLVQVRIKPREVRRMGARWRIDGGPWLKHRKIAEDVLIGDDHVIEFKPVEGFVTPKDKKVSVSLDMLTRSGGRYEATP